MRRHRGPRPPERWNQQKPLPSHEYRSLLWNSSTFTWEQWVAWHRVRLEVPFLHKPEETTSKCGRSLQPLWFDLLIRSSLRSFYMHQFQTQFFSNSKLRSKNDICLKVELHSPEYINGYNITWCIVMITQIGGWWMLYRGCINIYYHIGQ